MRKLIFSVLAAACVFAPRASAETWQRIAGFDSGIRQVRTVAVKDGAAWAELWAEHTRGMAAAPALPQVDFARETIVAVFLGERRRGGHVIELQTKPNPQNPAELVVTFGEKKPDAAFGIALMNYPYEIRKLNHAYAKVRFIAPQRTAVVYEAAEPLSEKPAPAVRVRLARAEVARLSGGLGAMTAQKSRTVFDGGALRDAMSGSVMAETSARLLPAALPPPPGKGEKKADQGKKKLPPPPKKDGKPLPPPPKEDGKPLPPPPARTLPRPIYPGGPLPEDDLRLRKAERTYSTYDMSYVGYWHDGWGYESESGRVVTSPRDRGSYVLNLTSGKYQYYVEFYYAKSSDSIYYTRTKKRIGGRSRLLMVEFADRDTKPLLPWESETFVFSLKDTTVSLESASGAYQYDITYSFSAQDKSTVYITLTPGGKIKTAPDAGAVGAGIKLYGSDLKLVVTDKWAQYYAGEELEVSVSIKKEVGMSWRNPLGIDPVIYDGRLKMPAQKSGELFLKSALDRGTYYISSWSFRRVDSAISGSGWVSKGGGNAVTK
ncbi:MAG: hypothetical protein ABIJ96_02560 [Elusimicrobiota bacterium]